MAKLDRAELKRTLDAWNAAGGKPVETAVALGIAPKTLRDRMAAVRAAFPDQAVATRREPANPTARAPETLDDHVDLHRAQEEERFAKARLKDALAEIGRLQDQIRDLRWASNAGFKPAAWTATPRRGGKSEHMPYLLTSDFQAGEVIRAEETEAGYGYDSATFCRRYQHLIQTTIDLCFGHGGSGWTYPGIIYARGGDAISGGIHEELRDTDDLTPIQAVQLVFEQEAAGILQLAEAFGRVDVKSPDAAGNHDRTTLKPRTKNAAAHSYDLMISLMLQREFRSDKRVSFQTAPGYDVVFPIYDRNILLTHGDRIGSRGGQGFVGPAATIMRGAQKVIQEQAALGRVIDRVDMGHFHTFLYYVWVLCNGCLPGYSEFAKSNRMRPQDPLQTLLFHHPKRGAVDIRTVNLRDA